MGFASGFTGGVTLTLSVSYLSILTHQRIREQQAQSLRMQALAIQYIIDPIPAPLPPTRSEVAAAQRATAVEVVKDRWNHEIQNAASWVQSKDWDEVREGVEQGVAKLWTSAFGESAVAAEQAKEKLGPLAQQAKSQADRKASQAASATRDAALDARRKIKSEASKAETATEKGADEAKGIFASVFQKSKDTVQQVADKAKATVGIAEDKVEVKADGEVLPATNAVDKALHQRYESPESRARLNKTVAQTLEERYKPVDQRDNTALRGV